MSPGGAATTTQKLAPRVELPVIQEWCFAPDTLVDTPAGKRRIDEVHEGDELFAFDFSRGQWVIRTALACHRSRYRGAVVSIETEAGRVEATAYHPFWVLEGHDLAHRPQPRELAEHEDEGQALQGRWVNSHDLFAGDVLLSREGQPLRVLLITQRYEDAFAVCNLTIDTDHTFAVGTNSLLVHNTGGCGHFGNAPKGTGRQLLPGEGAVGTYDELIAAGTKGDNITPHHIPSANHMRQHGVSKGDGISINM